jgi:hypothetical protein
LKLLADENFDNRLLRALARRQSFDITRVQDEGLMEEPDEEVLEWAARNGRVLLSHDGRTIPPLAFARVARGEPMPGVIIVGGKAPFARILDDLVLLVYCSSSDEMADQVKYVPQ